MFKKNWIRKLVLSLVFAVTTFWATRGLGFLGMALAGAGHGSAVLGYPFLSPIYDESGDKFICFGPYIWAMIAALYLWMDQWFVRLPAVILVGINGWSAFRDIQNDINEAGTASYVQKLFVEVPGIAIPLAVLYILMVLIVLGKVLSFKALK